MPAYMEAEAGVVTDSRPFGPLGGAGGDPGDAAEAGLVSSSVSSAARWSFFLRNQLAATGDRL